MVLAFVLLAGFNGYADRFDRRSEEASHILVGRIERVDSFFTMNRWGDTLIRSEVRVQVDHALKGHVDESLRFTIDGGTVGDITLKVSDLPLFEVDQVKKLYLQKVGDFFEYRDSENVAEAPVLRAVPAKAGDKCCDTFAAWPGKSAIFFVNPANADINLTCTLNDIQAAAQAWNAACGMKLSYGGTTSVSTTSPSDQNAIFFRSDSSGSTIAVTYTWYNKKKITAFDMMIYDGAWKFFSKQCGAVCSAGFFLKTIVTHELGHAIGLDHNNCASSMMYPYATYCANNQLTTEDIACARTLYGK
jgi:hypothetical protein